MSVEDLPALNATLNAIAFVLIVTALVMIKKGNERAHKNFMFAALFTSTCFLVSYVTHKALDGTHRPFPDHYGWIKYLYWAMLFTHVILAMVIVPLVLMAVRAALKDQREKHRRIVKWATPIWLYVSVTGVLIYFCIYQWFPA